MIQHGKIVVPTDFSEQADEALRRAGVLAGQFGAEVHLVHVLEPVVFFETDLISVYPMEEIVDAMREGARKRLAKQADAVEFDVINAFERSNGRPITGDLRFCRGVTGRPDRSWTSWSSGHSGSYVDRLYSRAGYSACAVFGAGDHAAWPA